MSGSTTDLRRRAGTDDDRTIEHVDVRGAQRLDDVRRREVGKEARGRAECGASFGTLKP